MKKHRLIIAAALCALGFSGVATASASATPFMAPPVKAYVYDASGLVRTVDCPTPAADPVCQGGVAGWRALTSASAWDHGPGPTDEICGFQAVGVDNLVYTAGFCNDASLALVERLNAAGIGGREVRTDAEIASINAWLNSFPDDAVAAKRAKAKKTVKQAAKQHGKRAKHAKR